MEGVEILKRGYLYDKKVGILPKSVDRKRWYVLKRELVGSAGAGVGGAAGTGVKVTLEIYKDEKAATKSEGPKGLIDIGNVVTVQRVTTKKQTFEILCPGVGYKLMANSDLEVDEWMQAIQLHITYKRNGHGSESFLSSSTSSLPILSQDAAALRSSSLGRGGYPGGHSHHQPHPSTHHMMSHLNSSHHPHHHQDNRMRTLSDSSGHPLSAGTVCSPGHTHFYHAHHQQPSSQHQYFHGQHTHQTVPIGLPAQRGMVHISHTLPTPPHSVSPPSYQPYHFSPVSGSGVPFQRQRSLESAAASSMASPSTSSDSSSMCSGSNTSFEGGGAGGGGGSSTGVFESDGWESRSTFRVQVNDPEHLKIVGLADLTVNDDGLRLHSLPPDQKELVFWPLGSLRKYGNSNHYFTIITGR